ncbi:MAG: hypothetical protein CMB99_01090 [Flavobacteriaceae bacterium]|nr:hypothetical protein [Flavobacteriaceae bacterium]
MIPVTGVASVGGSVVPGGRSVVSGPAPGRLEATNGPRPRLGGVVGSVKRLPDLLSGELVLVVLQVLVLLTHGSLDGDLRGLALDAQGALCEGRVVLRLVHEPVTPHPIRDLAHLLLIVGGGAQPPQLANDLRGPGRLVPGGLRVDGDQHGEVLAAVLLAPERHRSHVCESCHQDAEGGSHAAHSS